MDRLPQLVPPIPLFPGAFLSVPDCGVWSGSGTPISVILMRMEIHPTREKFMPRALSKTANMPVIPQLPLELLTERIPVAVQLTGIGRSKL